jgi:hypothetical protein
MKRPGVHYYYSLSLIPEMVIIIIHFYCFGCGIGFNFKSSVDAPTKPWLL